MIKTYSHLRHLILKFFEVIVKQAVLDFLTIFKNFSSLCEKPWNLMLQPLLSLTSPSVPNIDDVVGVVFNIEIPVLKFQAQDSFQLQSDD